MSIVDYNKKGGDYPSSIYWMGIFMIAFAVNVGRFTTESAPTNINQMTVLDKNRPWPILEYINYPTSDSITTFYKSRDPNYIENARSLVQGYIGEDINVLYAFPYYDLLNYSGDVRSEKLSAFPSFYLACPNSLDINNNIGGTIEKVGVYFPNLKKLLYLVSSKIKIGRVDDNGNITFVTTISGQFCNQFYNSLFAITCLVLNTPYNDSLDLTNIEIYDYLSVQVDGSKESDLSVYTSIRRYVSGGWDRFGFNYLIKILFEGNPKPDWEYKPDNPFEPIVPSGPDIPGGKFDDQSDIIGDSDLPSLSASDTGFTRIYIPTLSQVQDLARYLWTDETVVETIWNKIKQFFENPMEAIIGFNLVPVPVPSSGTKSFALMYIDTGVDMDTAANQFVDVDCGTFKLEYYYGSALDYSPYTKVSCFLPYIGMVQLNTDEVMNRTLQIKYRVDIVSGSCVAKILVDGNCIYQYSGHCAITIPISASDFTSYVSAAISVAKLAVGAAVGGAGGALSALAGAPTASQQTNQVITQTQTETAHYNAEGAFTGASITNRTQTRESPKNQSSTESSFAGLTPANISNTVGEIMGSKPHVQHSGSFSGNSGYLGVRRPFLILERPNLCLPENYQQLNGFPAMITMLLGECSGYTRVQQVELTGLPATNPEQAEILELLKSGVIF